MFDGETSPRPAKKIARAIIRLPAAALLLTLAVAAAHAEDPPIFPDKPDLSAISPTIICKDQTYALCATASCFLYNNVAYCKCNIRRGSSISARFAYPAAAAAANPDFDPAAYLPRQNICDLNAQGAGNGYMASMFSLPPSVLKGGYEALYTCPSNSTGRFAQCDGGICFTSSRGNTFPGFDTPLSQKEIICSCPVTQQSASMDPFGYQFVGPFPCDKKTFALCGQAASGRNGTSLPVGAPTGFPRYLSIKLYGKNPDVNECFP